MTGDEEKRPFWRVLVALDPSPANRSLVEAAAELAAWCESSLTGLFVEDEDLLAFAELPLAREVSSLGAVVRDLSRQSVQSQYQAYARQARRLLESAALARRVNFDFQHRLGRSALEVHAAVTAHDLVVVSSDIGLLHRSPARGLPTWWSTCRASALLRIRRTVAGLLSGPIAVVQHDSEEGRRALEVGRWLAARTQKQVQVVLGAGQGTVLEPAESGQGEMTVVRRVLCEPGESLAACIGRRLPATALVILPGDADVGELASLADLSNPVLVLRPTAKLDG